MVEGFLNWFSEFGASNTAVLIMFANAVGESVILPVPCDLVLIALATMRPENSLWYGGLTTIGSVLGAMGGYLIGKSGGRRILLKLFSAGKIARLDGYFDRYGVWAIFVAGFTPIPYKVFTIASGAARFNFTKFVLISILSRGLRFMAIGVLFFIFGVQIREWLDNNLSIVSWLALVLIVIIFLGYLAISASKQKREKANLKENSL
ncbi:MAG: DedA family protein [candidate division Zixibacteria bacterium]|nr:DedA family protein [candidate division Zixibacteria bacterium]